MIKEVTVCTAVMVVYSVLSAEAVGSADPVEVAFGPSGDLVVVSGGTRLDDSVVTVLNVVIDAPGWFQEVE